VEVEKAMKKMFAPWVEKRMNKRGQLSTAQNIAIGLVVLGLVAAIGGIILTDFQGTQTSGTAGYNITSNALTGLTNLSSQFGTVGTVGIAVVLLGLVFLAFGAGRNR
jgi:vacuolar-type H+-ATPase subunit I/STV1